MINNLKTSLFIIGSIFLISAVARGEPKVTTIRLPDGGTRPKAAIDSKGVVHIIYANTSNKNELYYIKQEAGEKEFSNPIKVLHDAAGMAASFNMSVGKDGRVHVLTRPTPKYSEMILGLETYQKIFKETRFFVLRYMLYSRLNHEGTAFEKEFNIVGKTMGFEGVGAIVGDQNSSKVFAFWNGRLEPGPESGKDMYMAVSRDEGKTWSEPEKLNVDIEGACNCCSMQAIMDADDNMYIVYRNSAKTGATTWSKDTYLLASKDLGQTWSKQLVQKWEKCGCPGAPTSLAASQHGVFFGYRTRNQSYFGKVDEILNPIAAPSTGKVSMKPMLAANKNGDVLFSWVEAKNVAWQVYDKDNKPLTHAKGLLQGATSRGSNSAVIAKEDGEFILYYDGN